MTIAVIGTKAEVKAALSGDRVKVWDGTRVRIARPITPLRWIKRPDGTDWRGEREAEFR